MMCKIIKLIVILTALNYSTVSAGTDEDHPVLPKLPETRPLLAKFAEKQKELGK